MEKTEGDGKESKFFGLYLTIKSAIKNARKENYLKNILA